LLELVGNTPLVRLARMATGLAGEVLVKMESMNPLGSVKDRIGLAMIEDAERRGVLSGDSVIVEPRAATPASASPTSPRSRGTGASS